jgi:hypothetical protein
MHAGITAITELAVESGLTNRLPPGQRETIFFLALSPLPKRRQFGFPWALQPPFSEHVSVWATSLAIRRLKQPANPPGVSRKTLRRLEYRLALEQSLRETLRLSYDACPNSSRRKMQQEILLSSPFKMILGASALNVLPPTKQRR